MPLLPEGPFALAALAVAAGGTALVAWRRDFPKAYGLAAVNFAVFLLQFAGSIFADDGLVEQLGFQPAAFLAFEQWWTPLTALFTHADLIHIFGNVFILLTAGPALEARVGPRHFLVIYFVAGLVALAAHVGITYTVPRIATPESVAIGASGAIFGILTAFAVRYPRAPLPVLLGLFVLWMPAFVVLLIYLGFNVAYLFGDYAGTGAGGIAWWGHFAGFLVGLPFAYTLPKYDPTGAPRGAKGLPDPDRLAPLATTPELRALLEKVRQFTPEARTTDDATFALAWVDRFLEKARCPTCGERFAREGLSARCARGETLVEFGRE